ncbi:hypothetical protein DSO57_1021159 [Entomophthora muscae]|uniref:Uncharacterized protein n=1 Tax=Entomophthora muscae TaxID=34485 RepID=A0ACC2TQU8_9FUNG|nr:hypothetical protein DSO57_1021159 [Entomophthora muscae]
MNPSIVFNPGGSSFNASTVGVKVVKLRDAMTASPVFQGALLEAIPDVELLSNPRLNYHHVHNGFAEAILLAHEQHHGLTLSPDQILIALAQALSIHAMQGEHMNRLWLFPVTPDGGRIFATQDLAIYSPIHDWTAVVCDFGDITAIKIRPEISNLLSLGFTTSTRASKTAASLSVIGVHHFLPHHVDAPGGAVPEIELMGTLNDWQQLRARVEAILSRFEDITFWKDPLLAVLDQFVAAASGRASIPHWKQMVKIQGVNQGSLISGWMNVFFPYLQTTLGFQKNPHINWTHNTTLKGMATNEIPCGFTKVHYPWFSEVGELPMEFVVGFLGVQACRSHKLTPSLQCAILHKLIIFKSLGS